MKKLKYNVGDKVVVKNNKYTAFEIGSIGKIAEIHSRDYTVLFKDQIRGGEKCTATQVLDDNDVELASKLQEVLN